MGRVPTFVGSIENGTFITCFYLRRVARLVHSFLFLSHFYVAVNILLFQCLNWTSFTSIMEITKEKKTTAKVENPGMNISRCLVVGAPSVSRIFLDITWMTSLSSVSF